MGELGATYTKVKGAGFGFVVRFTWIEYAVGGVAIPPWNAGAMFWIGYDFAPT